MKKSSAPAAARAQRLDPDEILASLAGRKGVVLAVSGGVDSTALMLLASRWSAPTRRLVVCVDHGIRPEAAAEAEKVAEQAGRLGLACRIMTCADLKPGGNLQARARAARYRCLAEAAADAGFDTIATAHHRDDQAETFLLRLARGSGVYGLAAMEAETETGGIRLARPLLDLGRADLAALVAESGLAVADDPSNRDAAFDRVRMRRLMPALEGTGIGAARLASTARGLRRAAAALDHYATALIRDSFEITQGGVARGRAEAFGTVPDEVALRAFSRLLCAVGGQDYPPRLDRLERALDALLAAGASACRRTLHGVVAEAEGGRLMLSREWGRSGLPETAIAGGDRALWDGRFDVRAPAIPGRLAIRPLGDAPSRLIATGFSRQVIRTMPGLFDGERLVAVPAGIEAAEAARLRKLAVSCLVGRRLGFTETTMRGAGGLTRASAAEEDGSNRRSGGDLLGTCSADLASTVRQPI